MTNDLNQFGGTREFDAQPERVFALLTNLDAVANTIPDLVSRQRIDERTMLCTVKPGFSFLRGTMKVTIQLLDVQAPSAAQMQMSSKGIGVAMLVRSQMRVEPRPAGGSLLHWESRIEELKGLVATVSPSLVRAAAEQVIQQSWQAVEDQLRNT